jgi:hypothetical protein
MTWHFRPMTESEKQAELARLDALLDATMTEEEKQMEWACLCDCCRQVGIGSPWPLRDPVCSRCRLMGRPGSDGEPN